MGGWYEGRAPYVFLRYAPEDERQAERIKSLLDKENVRYWDESALRVGSDRDEMVAERLGRAVAYLLVLTSEAMKSGQIRDELTAVLCRGTPVYVLQMALVSHDFSLLTRKAYLFLTEGALVGALPGAVHDNQTSGFGFGGDDGIDWSDSDASALLGDTGGFGGGRQLSEARNSFSVPEGSGKHPMQACSRPQPPLVSRVGDTDDWVDTAQRRMPKGAPNMAPNRVPKRTPNRAGGLLGLFGRRKKTAVTKKGKPPIVTPPTMDNVRFSAIASGKIAPGRYLPISLVMYEDAFRQQVDEIIRTHGKHAKEATSGYQLVARRSVVRVVLTSPEVTVQDSELEQVWNGKYLHFDFAAQIPGDFTGEQILLSAKVYINDLIATKLNLVVDCEGGRRHKISVAREDILSAFVSYASQDRNRVAVIIQGMKAARPDMDIFFDIDSLRSGEKWEDTLKEEIEKRDVLFLCWSQHAKDSRWVDMEWRYALVHKGEDGIEPIAIESPDVCPPPAELQQKYFNDKMLYIIKATMPSGNPWESV